ncbi:MAG: hypothetical protein HYW34_01080 [Candidatus Brennerbacteria bacterium]|nr:hypothetical protein [Candidatus Brennerbacteria bacterium]
MNKSFKKIATSLIGGLPFIALAQNVVNNGVGGINTPAGMLNANQQLNVGTIINNITSWVSGLLIAIAVLFVIYAAYLYLTSAGDAEKVKSASNYILYAVIAVVVALASRGLIALGRAIFGF